MPERVPVDLLTELEAVFTVVRTIVDEAHAAGNAKLTLLAAQRVATLAELAAKLRGELREGATVAIHMQPEFHALQRQLLAILAPHPELREEVARALLTSGTDANG